MFAIMTAPVLVIVCNFIYNEKRTLKMYMKLHTMTSTGAVMYISYVTWYFVSNVIPTVREPNYTAILDLIH